MVPFIYLIAPCDLRHSKRCNNQHLGNLKGVIHQVLYGSQGADRLAKAHLEYYCCYGVRLDELDRVFLIIMWLEFHQGFLQSALYHSGHTPESLSAEAAHAGAAAVALAFLPVPLPPQNRCGLVGEAPIGPAFRPCQGM